MKTRNEIEFEAQHLEQRLRDLRADAIANTVTATPRDSVQRWSLFTFPESSVKVFATDPVHPLTHRMTRHVEVVVGGSGLEYRLIEEEFVSDSEGRVLRHYDPIDLETSDIAFDVISAGYRRVDEDRLREG